MCSNCGMEEREDAAFCTLCGQPLVKSEVPAKKMPKGKLAFLAAVVVAVVSLIVVLAIPKSESDTSVSKKDINKSAKNAAIAGVEAEIEGDAEKLIEAYADFAIRDLAWGKLGLSENAPEKEVLKALREYYGERTHSKIEVLDAEIVSEWDEECLYLDLYDETAEEREQIEKFVGVQVTFLEGEVGSKQALNEENARERSVTVLCVKMDKKWYYLCSIHGSL